MADLLYHIRALDKDGNTVRQGLYGYATVADAQKAADIANRTRNIDEEFVVCESLDHKDPRNPKTSDPLKFGFIKYVAPVAP